MSKWKCFCSAHQDCAQGADLDCMMCAKAELARLRAENDRLLDHINERAAPSGDSIEELKRKNYEMYKHADAGWRAHDAEKKLREAAEAKVAYLEGFHVECEKLMDKVAALQERVKELEAMPDKDRPGHCMCCSGFMPETLAKVSMLQERVKEVIRNEWLRRIKRHRKSVNLCKENAALTEKLAEMKAVVEAAKKASSLLRCAYKYRKHMDGHHALAIQTVGLELDAELAKVRPVVALSRLTAPHGNGLVYQEPTKPAPEGKP